MIKFAFFSYLYSWDAVAIYFLKAKSFFYSKGFWDNPLYQRDSSYLYTVKAYPVGAPLVIAAFYRIIGSVNDQIIKLYHFIFYFLSILAMIGFVRSQYKNSFFLAPTLLVFGLFLTPIFLIFATNGYADIIIAHSFSVTIMFLIFLIDEKNKKLAVIYFIFLILISGFGYMIKNEGLVFFVTILASGFTIVKKLNIHKELFDANKSNLFRFGFILFSVIPILILFFIRKTYNIDYYFDNLTLSIANIYRIKIIIVNLFDQLKNTNLYTIALIPIWIVVIIQSTLLALHKKWRELLPFMVITLQFFYYLYIYYITPLPYETQIVTSLPRLILQLLPAMLIIIFYQMKQIWTIKEEL